MNCLQYGEKKGNFSTDSTAILCFGLILKSLRRDRCDLKGQRKETAPTTAKSLYTMTYFSVEIPKKNLNLNPIIQ